MNNFKNLVTIPPSPWRKLQRIPKYFNEYVEFSSNCEQVLKDLERITKRNKNPYTTQISFKNLQESF